MDTNINEILTYINQNYLIIISFLAGFSISYLMQKSKKDNDSPFVDYGIFDTTRAKTEFDMEEEEIKEFLGELKEQIEKELKDINKYIKNKDYINLKNSIHKIKGSAVNLGEGGIAKLLFEFNDYLAKNGKNNKKIKEMEKDIIYYKNLI